MWGLIPAAGIGSRIQPLAFSKELLPVGSRLEGGAERPRAVSEYLVDRMLLAGADKICFTISSGKSDILSYYGGSIGAASLFYVVQPEPVGLCDALFRALPLIGADEPVLVGLPDTVWFPEDGFRRLPEHALSLLLFRVERPERFDTVVCDPRGRVLSIAVKPARPPTRWIWGAFKLTGAIFGQLHELWLRRGRQDEFIGTLLSAYIEAGGEVSAVRAGEAYVDVGTLNGYREAIHLLGAPLP